MAKKANKANKEPQAAKPEEVKPLDRPLTLKEVRRQVKDNPDGNVKGVVAVELDDIGGEFEDFLDTLSDKLIGDDSLMLSNITHRIAGCRPGKGEGDVGEVYIEVVGEVQNIFGDDDDDEETEASEGEREGGDEDDE